MPSSHERLVALAISHNTYYNYDYDNQCDTKQRSQDVYHFATSLLFPSSAPQICIIYRFSWFLSLLKPKRSQIYLLTSLQRLRLPSQFESPNLTPHVYYEKMVSVFQSISMRVHTVLIDLVS